MKITPFHSRKQDVYHNNSRCTEGNNIEPENKLPGKGNKRLCHNCKNLNDKGQ